MIDESLTEDEQENDYTPHLDFEERLKQTVSSYYVANSLQEMSKTAQFSGRDIFFTTFLAMIEGLSRATNKEHHDSVQLDSLLGSWNLQRMRVFGDGNCFFTSVAT